jgi:cytochrome P450
MRNTVGPVVRTAPNEVVFTSSQAWEDIYGVRPGKPEMTKNVPDYQNAATPRSIISAERDAHRFYRRLLSRGFSDATLRLQESVFQEKLDLLMKALRGQAVQGETPDMTSWFGVSTFRTCSPVLPWSMGCSDWLFSNSSRLISSGSLSLENHSVVWKTQLSIHG